MAEEITGNEVAAASDLRASHDDRDRVVELLRVSAGDGRLTPEELDERVERALSARTYAELAALTADLPMTAAKAGLLPQPKDVIRIQCGSGHSKRNGPWVVPQRLEIRVTSGHVVLDFTQAVIALPDLRIDADIRSGHLLLVVKPGIVIDADDVAVRNGHVRIRTPWSETMPVRLRITISGKVGSGHLTARPPHRSFWQWLRRSPRPYAVTGSLATSRRDARCAGRRSRESRFRPAA
jgi:hypothetical protein